METSFYGDDTFAPSADKMKTLRKSLTLDLDAPMSKKAKFSCLLSSPDLKRLKLESPELEELIIRQQNGMVTTTPTPTQLSFSKTVTAEQEIYARGFVEALQQLQQRGTGDFVGFDPAMIVTTSSNNATYTLLPAMTTTTTTAAVAAPTTEATIPANVTSVSAASVMQQQQQQQQQQFVGSYYPVTVKEEPQTVPSVAGSPPLSPIDMMAQERIKLERKRQRNRVAASKCRRRKLERISRLEDKVNAMKNENSELSAIATKLRDTVCHLKQQLLEHANHGCQIMPHVASFGLSFDG